MGSRNIDGKVVLIYDFKIAEEFLDLHNQLPFVHLSKILESQVIYSVCKDCKEPSSA